MQSVLFAGCVPEVAAFDGRIIAVGAGARSAAGRRAEVIRLRGEAWPGLIDSHIHLEGLADKKLTVDLTGARDLREALARIKDWAREKPKDGWVAGSGWYNDAWPEAAFPNRSQLDGVAGKRPAFMRRKDGHSAWVSGEALKRAGTRRGARGPRGRPDRPRRVGRADRDPARDGDEPGGGRHPAPGGRRPRPRDGTRPGGNGAVRSHIGPLDGQRAGLCDSAAPPLARAAAGPRDVQPSLERPAARRADGRAVGMGRRVAALLGSQSVPRRIARQPHRGDGGRVGHGAAERRRA